MLSKEWQELLTAESLVAVQWVVDRKEEVINMSSREKATIALPELEEPLCCRTPDNSHNLSDQQPNESSYEGEEKLMSTYLAPRLVLGKLLHHAVW